MSDITKCTPTPAQREVLLGLKAESEKFESPATKPNVAEFIRDFSPPVSASVFSKIMNAVDDTAAKSYFDEIKKPDALMADLAEWLEKIPRLRLEGETARKSSLHKLSKFRAVAVGVRECKTETGPERIVKYIAPTGGSKTSLRRWLMLEFKNELSPAFVESRNEWRPATRDLRHRAKLVVLQDIAAALGFRFTERVSRQDVAQIEDELIRFCTEKKRLLFIDEAEFFSAYALNLVKLLLNKSRLIIVIACTPRAHAKWNSYYPDEADQISRRTKTVVAISEDDLKGDALKNTIADASLFFPKNQFADEAGALTYIVGQAWMFGHYSTINRVARELEKHSGAEKDQVEKAVTTALKQMAKERAGRGK